MNKKQVAVLLTLWFGLVAWVGINKAQVSLFDSKKTHDEIEVMKGIIQTSLKNAFRDNSKSSEWDDHFGGGPRPNISGYYLYGQGVVFELSVSSVSLANFPKVVKPVVAIKPPKPPKPPVAPKTSGSTVPAPEAPPPPPVPPPPPADLADLDRISGEAAVAGMKAAEQVMTSKEMAEVMKQVGETMKEQGLLQKEFSEKYQNDLRRSLEESQKSLQEWRTQSHMQRQNMEKQREAMKPVLIEVLARYGDSMSFVKPEEYITLILSSDRWGDWGSDEEETRLGREAISVKKSTIMDYKLGKISIDDFKKRVLIYQP